MDDARRTMSKTAPPKPDMISAYGISKRIHRSRTAVLEAIDRLQLVPVLILPAGTYYPLDAVKKVKAAMRKPNRKREA